MGMFVAGAAVAVGLIVGVGMLLEHMSSRARKIVHEQTEERFIDHSDRILHLGIRVAKLEDPKRDRPAG